MSEVKKELSKIFSSEETTYGQAASSSVRAKFEQLGSGRGQLSNAFPRKKTKRGWGEKKILGIGVG